MDHRYTNPLVLDLWSAESTYGMWLTIERTVLARQLVHGVIGNPDDQQEANTLLAWLAQCHINEKAVDEIRAIERTVKHDVVAFLQYVRKGAPVKDGPTCGRWLHFGLTSSDLVDTALGMRFAAIHPTLRSAVNGLLSAMALWADDKTAILGRTHGQVAEPMQMRARAAHWLAEIGGPASDLMRTSRRMQMCKLSGPVGTFAHNPPEVERGVASDIMLSPVGMGASQIAPRAPLAAWANAAALLVRACGKVALDVRLMAMLGEVNVHVDSGQVGSSSMAHKRNPIRAEQVAGMVRLASGYAQMLQPLDLWLERDISNSSVERVAIPDLWHVVLHTLKITTELLHELQLDCWQIKNQMDAGHGALVSGRTIQAIRDGLDADSAREHAMKTKNHPVTECDASRAMANWPDWKAAQRGNTGD